LTDLISRQALLDAFDLSDDAVLATIHNAPAIKPQVVCNITGGLLQGASSDYPVDVYTLDFDYDGESPDSAILDPDGEEAWFGQTSAVIDPEFVRKCVEAPTLAEADATA
jgi:hypothetical protein